MKILDEVNNLTMEIEDCPTMKTFFNTNYIRIDDGDWMLLEVAAPEIVKVNHDAGYIVLGNGTIVCSQGCNSHVMQYDGCTERELKQSFLS